MSLPRFWRSYMQTGRQRNKAFGVIAQVRSLARISLALEAPTVPVSDMAQAKGACVNS